MRSRDWDKLTVKIRRVSRSVPRYTSKHCSQLIRRKKAIRNTLSAVRRPAAAQRGEVSSGRESLEACGSSRYIWGFIFPFGVRRKNARTRRNRYSKPPADGSMTLMLEIKQEGNAGRINSGSTAKSVKTQAFYSEVNSCESALGKSPACFLSYSGIMPPLNSDERI